MKPVFFYSGQSEEDLLDPRCPPPMDTYYHIFFGDHQPSGADLTYVSSFEDKKQQQKFFSSIGHRYRILTRAGSRFTFLLET
ncbi:hypothetical protein TNCV_769541 [Trichonephila clavipes]|nr:hypothetical protein TNCV_769541 [Trichonephila clavipes]